MVGGACGAHSDVPFRNSFGVFRKFQRVFEGVVVSRPGLRRAVSLQESPQGKEQNDSQEAQCDYTDADYGEEGLHSCDIYTTKRKNPPDGGLSLF